MRVVRTRDDGCAEMQWTHPMRNAGKVRRGAGTRETCVPVQRRGSTDLAPGTHRGMRVQPGLE